jgi:hypothetical protein
MSPRHHVASCTFIRPAPLVHTASSQRMCIGPQSVQTGLVIHRRTVNDHTTTTQISDKQIQVGDLLPSTPPSGPLSAFNSDLNIRAKGKREKRSGNEETGRVNKTCKSIALHLGHRANVGSGCASTARKRMESTNPTSQEVGEGSGTGSAGLQLQRAVYINEPSTYVHQRLMLAFQKRYALSAHRNRNF